MVLLCAEQNGMPLFSSTHVRDGLAYSNLFFVCFELLDVPPIILFTFMAYPILADGGKSFSHPNST